MALPYGGPDDERVKKVLKAAGILYCRPVAKNENFELPGAELDVGWATYAGVDVADLIRRLGHRVRILHVKDLAPGFAAMERERIYVPAGQGACDYPAAFAAADRYARPDYRIVLDQDPSDRDGVADSLASAAYLARWTDR